MTTEEETSTKCDKCGREGCSGKKLWELDDISFRIELFRVLMDFMAIKTASTIGKLSEEELNNIKGYFERDVIGIDFKIHLYEEKTSQDDSPKTQ